ncbi:transposase, MuDR, MULE transposase domain protein [Tanacetum coccineum]
MIFGGVTAARPINTVVHKPFANVAKPRTNVFQKAHSSLRRPFYQQTVLKNRNLSNQVNTANVISVNTVGKQGINAVKPTAYWAWRPKVKMINHVYKNTGFCVCKQFDYVDPTGRNKVLNSPYFMVKSWLVQDQTALGQMATGKESSNPFMAEAKDSEVCKITKADGTSSFHGDFQALLRRLDRQDLFQLYSLVQERYKHCSLEGHDLDLWGDLKMMFDPNEEDDIWLNQHHWELLRWKLHEYSGVHSLFLDGTSIQINMLVDKKYPLKKEILKKMINLKIEAEEESNMASELIKFIKSQIAEQVNHKFRGGLLGIKELLQDMLLKNLVPLVIVSTASTIGAWVSATNYVNAFGCTVTGCLGDIDNFFKKGKLKQVVAIVKSCSLNALGDLNMTLKDLSGTVPGIIHYKVLDVGSYEKDITVGAAMILANVSVFTPKPSKHYLNITKRNVVEVFRKDTVSLA